jgi:hypothetical protein
MTDAMFWVIGFVMGFYILYRIIRWFVPWR